MVQKSSSILRLALVNIVFKSSFNGNKERLESTRRNGHLYKMADANDSLEDRAARADKIVRDPSKYKICDGCDSIVLATATTCPSCHAYRFIDDQKSVINQARELGQRERRSLVKGDFE